MLFRSKCESKESASLLPAPYERPASALQSLRRHSVLPQSFISFARRDKPPPWTGRAKISPTLPVLTLYKDQSRKRFVQSRREESRTNEVAGEGEEKVAGRGEVDLREMLGDPPHD